jgi:ribonuclease BN (tRNA processing enzyme)
VAYTGDSGPSPTTTQRYVMTATEAATGAAGAQTLLLTHFWPGSDRSVNVTEAQKVFAGEVIAAEEGLVLTL